MMPRSVLALAVAVWLSGCAVTVHTEDHVRVTTGPVHVTVRASICE